MFLPQDCLWIRAYFSADHEDPVEATLFKRDNLAVSDLAAGHSTSLQIWFWREL